MSARTSAATPVSTLDGSSFLIGRKAEADRLCAFIVGAGTPFVALHGQPASGKSVLVQQWLLPALRDAKGGEGFGVYYGKCDPRIPDVLEGETATARFDEVIHGKSIIVLDEFDRVLDESRDERQRQLDALFGTLLHDRTAIVVVIVSARQLTSVYALSSYDADIVNAIVAMKSVGLAEGLQKLSAETGAEHVDYSTEVLTLLEAEAKAAGMDVTFDFVKLIHTRFQQAIEGASARTITAAHYRDVGGIVGILRAHVDQSLAAMDVEHAGRADIARAVLVRVLDARTRGASPDAFEVASRMGVAVMEVDAVRARLARIPGGLLIASPNGDYEFQPPQIVTVIEADRATQQFQVERTQRIIEEGVRSWQLLGTFLPPARFAEIHRQRRELILPDELVRFLFQCALRQEDADPGSAAEYWLKRMASRDDAIDVLLSAVLSPSVSVRARAAELLAPFDDGLVRERLLALALTDEAQPVRDAAVASLAHTPDDALLAQVLQELRGGKSSNRERAVDVLRIFPQPEVTGILQALVNDPVTVLELRTHAVSALAAINSPAAVDALLDIALDDPDEVDRKGAARALALTQTDALNRRILTRLDWPRPTWRLGTFAFLITLSAGVMVGLGVNDDVGDVTPWGTAAAALHTFVESMPGTLVLAALAAMIATRLLLPRLESGRLHRRSPLGTVAIALFMVLSLTVFPYAHGLAHMLFRRKARGLALLALEAVSFVLVGALPGAMEAIPGLAHLATVYSGVGVLLFIATYVFDVVPVALDTFVLKEQMTREARRKTIYRQAFGNPAMTTAVFGVLGDGGGSDLGRARRLIRRFGACMEPATLASLVVASSGRTRTAASRALSKAKDNAAVVRLESLYATATKDLRHAITYVLSRRPTAPSIEALERLEPGSSRMFRVVSWFARLRFRLNVWPRLAQAVVVLAMPILVALLYHGFMMTHNHAWGEIILLRQSQQNEHKARIVDFLAEVYEREAEPELRRLLDKGVTRPVDDVHASVVRGLIAILDRRDDVSDSLHATLAHEAIRFDSLLHAADTVKFRLALEVMGAMTRSRDTTLAGRARRLLVAYATAAGRDQERSAPRVRRTVHVLGQMNEYTEALPALDSVLKSYGKKGAVKGDAAVVDDIQGEMIQVAKRAYADLPAQGDVEDRKALLGAVKHWLPNEGDLIAQLSAEVAPGREGDCDVNHDGKCDGKDDALRAIAKRPTAEEGYRDLYRHYVETDEYLPAAAAFETLASAHRESIWPSKILSEIYHENLAPKSDAYFAKSYAAATELRAMPAYAAVQRDNRESYRRVEMDYAEVALSARHFDVVDDVTTKVMALEPEPYQRMNALLFRYLASVMRHDAPVARVRLKDFADAVARMPSGFDNTWAYPGTLAFISRSDLSAALKQDLRNLCKAGEYYPPARMAELLASNLAHLEPRTAAR